MEDLSEQRRPCAPGTTVPDDYVGDYDSNPQDANPCHGPSLPCGGMWSDWSEWGPCSVTCGRGVQLSTRTCNDGDCSGPSERSRQCSMKPCQEIFPWGEWSACSVSCGTGVQTRGRTCSGDCTGVVLHEERKCVVNENCLGPWSEWSGCSVSCGEGGLKYRQRTCEGDNCGSAEVEQSTSCVAEPPYCLSPWSEWGDCSVTCGNGTQTRTRSCTGQCSGIATQESQVCVADPPYCTGPWSTDVESPCSVSCGNGTKTYTRICFGKCENVETTRVVPCVTNMPCFLWTDWLNKDTPDTVDGEQPGGDGDYEIDLNDPCGRGNKAKKAECRTRDTKTPHYDMYVGVVPNPVVIQCEVFPIMGLVCANENVPNNGVCADFEVRFLCPNNAAFHGRSRTFAVTGP